MKFKVEKMKSSIINQIHSLIYDFELEINQDSDLLFQQNFDRIRDFEEINPIPLFDLEVFKCDRSNQYSCKPPDDW